MPLTFAIRAYSDLDPIEDRKPLWGDYWFKHHLIEALMAGGAEPSEEMPDVLVHLFGTPMPNLPKARLRLLWIHSHPDRITPSILARYDYILCSSQRFCRRLACSGLPVDWLMTPTHMKGLCVDKIHPVVFVGNNRRDKLRRVMALLLEHAGELPVPPSIWGDGWEGKIPESWYRGRSIPNADLNRLYSSAALVLNDHHDDMAREGFINPRIVDAILAGALVLTDPVAGLEDVAELPVYRSGRELLDQISRFLESPAEQKQIMETARRRLSGYTYPATARIILAKVQERISGPSPVT